MFSEQFSYLFTFKIKFNYCVSITKNIKNDILFSFLKIKIYVPTK